MARLDSYLWPLVVLLGSCYRSNARCYGFAAGSGSVTIGREFLCNLPFFVAQRPIFAATLLCTLDRIFDDVTAFKLRGKSFRGKKLEIGFSANRKAICN